MKEYDDYSKRGKPPQYYRLTGRDGPPGLELKIHGAPAFLCQNDASVWPARGTPLDKGKLWTGVHYIRKSLTSRGLNLTVLRNSGREILLQNNEPLSGRTSGRKAFDIPFYNNRNKQTKLVVMEVVCKKNRMERELMCVCRLEEC